MGARVSHVQGNEKVSHLAQHEEGARFATGKGADIVGTFEDLNVSAGTTTPFERPDLGQWLKPERLHEWDMIVFHKIDRAFRSTDDCLEFAKFIRANRKILAFSGDGLVLNYHDQDAGSFEAQLAEFFIFIGAFFAQIELNRFKTRAQDRAKQLLVTDRIGSGSPPLGFRTVPHRSGKGKALERDPEGYALLHEMYRKLVEERWTLTQLARWLTSEGKTTSISAARGRTPRWTVTGLRTILRSLRTQGIKVSRVSGTEQPVLDAEGNLIRMAEPTFTDEQWRKLQAYLDERAEKRQWRSTSDNPLAGFSLCLNCGTASLCRHNRTNKLADGTEKTYTYVRCGGDPGCKGAVRIEEIDRRLDEFFEDHAAREVTRRELIPGSDRTAELETAKKSLARLQWESDNGIVDDEQAWQTRMLALTKRVRELSAETVIPARWVDVGIGKTYGELWNDPEADRRQLIREAGVLLGLNGTRIIIRPPDSWDE